MDSKRKGMVKAASTVVTEGAAQAVLRRGPARELSAEEERVMRMRLGASLPRTGTLEWTSDELSEDQQIELMAAQIEAWMRWKAHLATVRAPARAQVVGRAPASPARARTTPAPVASRAKDKIVRALRKKG
jgi:hypothetical protein